MLDLCCCSKDAGEVTVALKLQHGFLVPYHNRASKRWGCGTCSGGCETGEQSAPEGQRTSGYESEAGPFHHCILLIKKGIETPRVMWSAEFSCPGQCPQSNPSMRRCVCYWIAHEMQQSTRACGGPVKRNLRVTRKSTVLKIEARYFSCN